MPSDTLVAAALRALAPAIGAFRAYVADGLAHVDRQIAALEERAEQRGSRAATELGAFGADRIDATRFAALVGGAPVLDPDEVSTLHELRGTLAEFERASDERFVVDVPAGGQPGYFVGDALADFGRAFGAASAAELLRTGRFADAGAALLEPLPASRWTAAQRAATPPIVVCVDGADCRAAGLAPYLDGTQKIVLVVRGACPPAPLVRLITPGVFVAQSNTTDALAAVARADTPAVLALVPEGAATFVHTPDAALPPARRLVITFAPAAPRRPIGEWSAFQQREELLQLLALAGPAGGGAAPAEAPGSPEAIARLAGWLLAQAGS